MKYRVLYRSEGILSGHEPGDEVTITDSHDASKLETLGLIRKVREAPAKTETKTESKDDAKPAATKAPAKPAATK